MRKRATPDIYRWGYVKDWQDASSPMTMVATHYKYKKQRLRIAICMRHKRAPVITEGMNPRFVINCPSCVSKHNDAPLKGNFLPDLIEQWTARQIANLLEGV